MNLNIGQVIKQLRISQSITQEKLADYLNVSPQSISKWENGLSYPDITLIPTIALFFNVTTDELFSLPTYINNQKFTTFQIHYEELQKKGAVKEQIALCRNMFLEYPRNYVVMSHLAHSLIACYEGLDAEHQLAIDNNYLNEAIKLNELILSDCNDPELQLKSIKLLCMYYPKLGHLNKSLTLLDKLSSISFCKELLLEDILTGNECIQQQQSNLLRFTDYIGQALIHLSFTKNKCLPNLSIEEKINFVGTSNQIYELIISDENYLYYHSSLAWNHRRLGELYLARNDYDQSIHHLNLAFYHAKSYDQLPVISSYTSPFVSNCEFNKNTVLKTCEGNECKRLYYMLTAQGTFDELKGNPSFNTLLQDLSHYIN